MKNKQTITILFLVIISNLIYAQEFLVQNSDHLIYYEFIEDEIIFTIEDLKDNENNIRRAQGEGGRNIFCGLEPKEQRNWNNGNYYFRNDQYDEAWAEFDVFHNGTFSYILCRGSWSGSDFKSTSHPVWTFEQPISNFLKTEDFTISVRFFISRVAKNQLKSIDYKTYYYPDQECAYGKHSSTSDTTFFIDLSGLDLSIIEEMKQQALKRKREQELAKLVSETYNNLVTCEAFNNATNEKPLFSGVFVKLVDGKIIEIPDQGLTYGMPYYGDGRPSKSTVIDNVLPFYSETEFDQIGIVKIKKDDILNFMINPIGGDLKSGLSLLSFHKIVKVDLAPITNCRIIEYPGLKEIKNMAVYHFDKKLISLIKENSEDGYLKYRLNSSLDEGLYGFWINEVAWIMEITK